MDDMLMRMVMEAENSRKRNAQRQQDDGPTDYSADVPEPDDDGPAQNDAGGDEPIDYSADVPEPDDDTSGGEEGAPPEDQGAPDEGPTDYGADVPSPDDDQGAGDEPPPEQAGDDAQAPAPDDAGGGDAPADDGPTDYGADVPSPDGDDAQGGEEGAPPAEGDQEQPPAPDQGDGGQPPTDEGQDQGGGDAPAEGDDQAQPDDGSDEFGAPAEDPAPGELSDDDKVVIGFTLERDFIRLYKDIRTYIRKIQDAQRETILAAVVSDIVITNLEKIREMTYHYIIFEFDHASYEEALFNFNYIIEMVRRNLAMIKTVKDAEDKANKLKDKSSKTSTSK
jgi:hypothetical protein